MSACAYCDVSKSQDAWSVRTGFDWDSSKAPGEDCGEGEGAPPEEKKCDYCGGCYNRDGRHTVECVHGYDAKCWAWYAPFECPTSSCQATNDDEWGKPCLAPGVLDNCYGTEACGPGPNAAPAEGGGSGSKKKKKSSNDSLALGLGLGLGLGGLLLIGLIAALCLSKKKKSSTSTREQDVENEMVKTGAAMS